MGMTIYFVFISQSRYAATEVHNNPPHKESPNGHYRQTRC